MTSLLHAGTPQSVFPYVCHRIPDTVLSLSCQNQPGQGPSSSLKPLCFGGCCHLVSVLGQVTCCCRSSLLLQESWVQRTGSEAVEAALLPALEIREVLVWIFGFSSAKPSKFCLFLSSTLTFTCLFYCSSFSDSAPMGACAH